VDFVKVPRGKVVDCVKVPCGKVVDCVKIPNGKVVDCVKIPYGKVVDCVKVPSPKIYYFKTPPQKVVIGYLRYYLRTCLKGLKVITKIQQGSSERIWNPD